MRIREGVDFNLGIGQRYRFTSQKEDSAVGGEDVIIEITEPMEPCANLCKLPYINDPSLASPRERVARCQYLLEALGVKQGMRGWYSKVIQGQGGIIRVGDSFSALGAVA